MEEIKKKIRSFIVETILLGYEEGFEDDSSFQDDGIIDSTGILELIDFLESEFSIIVNEEELIPENIDSLNKVTRFVFDKTHKA